MLDSDTKRRIDSCRDILVGKVPDPKSQVEQITIALIYKFMDDMDAQSEEFGGKRSFFVNGFEKYGWSKLLAPSMGGQATLNLYSEAISKMTENTHLPTLFRDIFKNAYLPYRDPETLRSFLKEIDGFSYDHSERLGDAFEYLLSVLGSQGDAGQFRTPRHIIDFIVRVINPEKHERILDPACGTAGFLISAWKYILDQNMEHQPGDRLTPAERGKLAANIRGYDISPDMVRLSLVNLYLHGFTDPHVDEYDTLTSEEKWNETADVILANPPFMSPKGGIKPHKRFSIQATRSEVLFVDFIHEHLSANGRAGVIVPDGVVFQNGSSYKSLRKLLVQSSLVAVVSLPAGVFQPYSGVKTSILILDKRLSKRTENVLFVKVSNDGFALGAQRRPIDKNDLPQAEAALRGFFSDPNQPMDHQNAEIVERNDIAENGEWSLSSDRYLKHDSLASLYHQVPLGGAISTIAPPAKLQKTTYLDKGRYPIIDQSQSAIAGWTEDSAALIHPDKPLVIFGDHTCAVKLIDQPFAQGADGIKIIRTNDDLVPEYLFHFLKTYPIESDGYKRHFTDLKRLMIPLPPVDVQREIVMEVASYRSVIEGARLVLDSYRPRIHSDPEWPVKRISEVAEINPKKSQLVVNDEGALVSFVPMSDLRENEMFFEAKEERAIGEVFKQYTYFENDDVLIAKVTPCFENGKAGVAKGLVGGVGFGSSEFYVIRADDQKVLPEWLYLHIATPSFRSHGANRMTGTGGLQRVPRDVLADWLIPVPRTTDEQQVIIDEILAEQELIKANMDLIVRFEEKIRKAMDRVWVN